MAKIVFRARSAWTDPRTPKDERRSAATFRASWADTQVLLRGEADYLDAHQVVIEVVCDEADLRQDGQPRARARVRHEGAVVHLDSASRGPMRIACDTYEERWSSDVGWQANVRAVALTLGALRAVDRYGAARSGQQYTGWQALGPGTGIQMGVTPRMTHDEAVALLAKYGGRLAALRATHPDAGGNPAEFARVQDALRVLEMA